MGVWEFLRPNRPSECFFQMATSNLMNAQDCIECPVYAGVSRTERERANIGLLCVGESVTEGYEYC